MYLRAGDMVFDLVRIRLADGEPISLAQLRSYLEIVRDMEPRPFTVLRVEEGTDCAWLQTVRQAIAQSLPCDKGGCGEGSGWDWDR